MNLREGPNDLPFPIFGISARAPHSRPNKLTTDYARNVRGRNTKTRRDGGSQRRGLSKHLDAPLADGPVAAMTAVAFDRPRIDYTALTPESNGRTDPDRISIVWDRAPVEGSLIVDARRDLEGNVYSLEGATTIVKRNSEGELLSTLTVPLRANQEIVPKIQVDAFGNLYCAGAHTTAENGSVLWRFARVEAEEGEEEVERYEQTWELALPGTLTDFALYASQIWLVLSRAEQDIPASLALVGFVNAPQPSVAWTRAIPSPCNAISITPTGSAITTHEPNAQRGAVDEDNFVAGQVFWTPHENVNSEERLHAWHDAQTVIAGAIGDPVTSWPDRRFELALEPGTEGQGGGNGPHPTPHDTTSRRLYRSTGTNYTSNLGLGPVWEGVPPNQTTVLHYKNLRARAAPRYFANAFGPMPGLRFDGRFSNGSHAGTFAGQALISGRSISGAGKLDTNFDGVGDADGKHPAARATIYSTNRQDTTFCLWMVIRADDLADDEIREEVLMVHNFGPVSTGIGKLRIHIHGPLVADRNRVRITVNPVGGGSETSGSFLLEGQLDASTRVGILTLNIAGAFTPIFGTEQLCSARLNGRPMARFNLGGTPWASHGSGTEGVGPNTVFGHYSWVSTKWTYVAGEGTAIQDELYGFTGSIGEIIVMLGDTLASVDEPWPNNVPVTQPLRADTGLPPLRHTLFGGSNNFTGTVTPLAASLDVNVATEVERVEGYLAHRWGVPAILPSEFFPDGTVDMDATNDQEAGSLLYKYHPFGGVGNFPSGVSSDILVSAGLRNLFSAEGIVAKWGPNGGDPQWAFAGGGVGYGVVHDGDRGIFCVGPKGTTPYIARKLIDRQSNVSALLADGAWARAGADEEQQTYRFPRLAVDDGRDFYWPVASERGFLALTIDGSANSLAKLDGRTGELVWFYRLPNAVDVFSVALEDGSLALADQGIHGPEFLYLTTNDGGEEGRSCLYKLRLVAAAQNVADGASTRHVALVGVSLGNVSLSVDGAPATALAGGTGVIALGSPFVQLVTHIDKVFGTDGLRSFVIDPRKGTVEPYKAKSAGRVPPRFKLIASWMDSIFMARYGSGTEWTMTAQGDPFDLDTFPVVPTEASAASSSSPRGPGLSPAIITALMPGSDDLMFVGHDSAISRLTGHPLAGGRWDLVSDQIGVAFGKSWTKDWIGNIYFQASVGGIFAIGPDGPRHLSEEIDDRLRAIDLTRYRLELIYDSDEEGLYVFQIPTIGTRVPTLGWFRDATTSAWFEDDYQETNVQPTASCILDGDGPQDRRTLVGCEDGYVRFLDRLADDDDGVAIYSEVEWLLYTGLDGREVRIANPLLCLSGQGAGGELEFLSAVSADQEARPVGRALMRPGLNPAPLLRAAGGAVRVRFRNRNRGEWWGFESLNVEAYRGARRRIR